MAMKGGIVVKATTNSAIYEKGLKVLSVGRLVKGIRAGDKVIVDGRILEKFYIDGKGYASIRYFDALGKIGRK